jgi:hypothetical protein
MYTQQQLATRVGSNRASLYIAADGVETVSSGNVIRAAAKRVLSFFM